MLEKKLWKENINPRKDINERRFFPETKEEVRPEAIKDRALSFFKGVDLKRSGSYEVGPIKVRVSSKILGSIPEFPGVIETVIADAFSNGVPLASIINEHFTEVSTSDYKHYTIYGLSEEGKQISAHVTEHDRGTLDPVRFLDGERVRGEQGLQVARDLQIL